MLRAWKLIKSNVHFAVIAVDPRFWGEVELDFDDLKEASDYFNLVLGETVWNRSKGMLSKMRAGTGYFKQDVFTRCNKQMDKEKAIIPYKILLGALQKKLSQGNDHLAPYIAFIEEIIFLLGAPTGIVMAEKSFCFVRKSHDWYNSIRSKSLINKLVKYGVNWRLRNNVY